MKKQNMAESCGKCRKKYPSFKKQGNSETSDSKHMLHMQKHETETNHIHNVDKQNTRN